MIGDPIKDVDQNDANIEIQYHLLVEKQTNLGVIRYEISLKFYHTTCSIFIQVLNQNTDSLLADGRYPVQSFNQDFLSPVMSLIKNKFYIDNETIKLKRILSNLPPGWNSAVHSCFLCGNDDPPNPKNSQNSSQCDVCKKKFHIQCFNKGQTIQIRLNNNEFVCSFCQSEVSQPISDSQLQQK